MNKRKHYSLEEYGKLENDAREASLELSQIEDSLYEHIHGPDYTNLIKLGCWVVGSMLIVCIAIRLWI